MSTKMTDGCFSAVLLVTAGTFEAPTAFIELDLVTDTVKVPWGAEPTKSSARRGRNAPIFVKGPGKYAAEVDLQCEQDEGDTTLATFEAAIESGAILKVIFCNHTVDPDDRTSAPHPEYSYIIGEYQVYGGDEDKSSGKVNGKMLQLRRGPDCKRAVRVLPD